MKIRSVMGVAAALCCSVAALAQPANDQCANAEAVAVPSVTAGTLVAATAEAGIVAGTCVTSYSATLAGVWYTVTGTGNTITADLCSTATSFDTKMFVFCSTGNLCSSLNALACVTGNDDGASPCGTVSPIRLSKVTFCSTLGQTYYILVQPFSSTVTLAPFTLTVADNATACTGAASCAVGACCSSSGTCTITSVASCTGTSTHQGIGTSCSPTNPCTAQLRACCSGTGTCSLTMPAGCATATQTFLSGNTVCTPTNPCTALLNACCSVTGTCSLTTANGCAAPSSYQSGTVACTPTNPCPAAQACCINQCCSLLVPTRCTTIGGTPQGPASVCTVNPCTTLPANDLCSAAIGTTVGVLTYGGNCGATPLTATEVPAPTCNLTNSSRSVWYTVTPATTGLYTVSTCGSFDTVVDVLTSPDCVAFTAVACDDDTCAGGEPGPIGTGSSFASLIGVVQLNGGQLYYIRVSSFGTSTSGFFQLLTSANALAGACCNTNTGACTISATGAPGCPAGTSFLGGVCTPNPCPQPSGACCHIDGTCTIEQGSNCINGDAFQGPATTCSGPNSTCPATYGSCCNNTTGVCTYIVTTATCTGGTFTSGGVCNPDTCPKPGRCCIAGCCTFVLQSACTGSWTLGGSCTPNPCGGPANDNCSGATSVTVGSNAGTNACASTSFVITPETQCGTTTGAGGARDVWHTFIPTQSANYTFSTCATPGFDTTLALYNGPACPADGTVAPRACNDDTAGTCAVSTLRSEIPNQLLIAGQTYIVRVAAWGGGTAEGAYVLNITQGAAAGACCTGTSCAIVLGFNCTTGYQGDFTTCGPNTCDPLGECCDTAGGCTVTTQSGCTGSWTVGGTCTPNNCPLPAGACCCGSTCTSTLAAACTGTNQSFKGAGTVCNVYGTNNVTPCCFADYNQSGAVGVQDIFDFLAAYFGQDNCADINQSGPPPSVQDIFDFLAAYFAGCV